MLSTLNSSKRHIAMISQRSVITTTTTSVRSMAASRRFVVSKCRNDHNALSRQQLHKQPRCHSHHHSRCGQRRAKTTTTASPKEVPEEPSFRALQFIALAQAIPFIGFGFMDNAILIVAGDAIDTSLGVVFGISTLCAAAIGNIISDLAGIGLGTLIEDFCANYLRLPQPNLTPAQRQLRSVRFAGQFGMAAGMTFGCIIGMFPLLFIDSDKITRLKQKAKIEALFRDVVTEAKSLVGAESTLLYLRVDNKDGATEDTTLAIPYKPNASGDHLYAMFYDVPKTIKQEGSRVLPLGKGIVSRAMLTAQAWKIEDVHTEPDFYPVSQEEADHMRQMLVVPVLDSQGRAIAAIRAMNKVEGGSSSSSSKGGGGAVFTDQDVLILKSLASHISVTLQSLYQEEQDEDARLRDTIRILKEHGIEGLDTRETHRFRPLFPELE